MAFVTDTMALVLFLENRKSGSHASSIFQQAQQGQETIHIPAIVMAEVGYLSERGRITCTLADILTLVEHTSCFQSLPLSHNIIERAFTIPDIPELHDRLIAASANYLGLALITNDPAIINSAYCNTIW